MKNWNEHYKIFKEASLWKPWEWLPRAYKWLKLKKQIDNHRAIYPEFYL